jgi:RHS repeat-associated protein
MRAALALKGVRKSHSARYFNPFTGRFMSRDPLDPQFVDSNNKPIDPRKLHKYLYGGGDPVNWIDPTGREESVEAGFTYTEIGVWTAEAVKKFIAGPVACAFAIDAYAISAWNGGNAMDNTLGGTGTAAGCAFLLLGW